MFTGKFRLTDQLPAIEDARIFRNIIGSPDLEECRYGEIVVYFLGVLYNQKALGFPSEMKASEILARLYEKSGPSGFIKLDGSFTCILYTPEEVCIVRDHHGTNAPVFYTERYFASSLLLLQKTEGFTTIPNYQALGHFLSIGYIATPQTSLENVKKLGAGECLIYKNGQIKIIPLYVTDSILPPTGNFDLEELSSQYGELHAKAICKRIEGCRNVGILLSGGYDSGCNLAALRKQYSGPIHSFSIGFKGDNWTELPLARCMSETFQTIHTEYEIDGSEIINLPEIVKFLGDPFVEGGLMVNYSVMKLIGENKPDIILGGDGSDQYFGTSGREVALHYLISKYGIKPLASLLFSILDQPHFDKNTSLYRVRFHLDKILNILQGDLFGFPVGSLKEMVQEPTYFTPLERLKSDTRSFEHLYTQHAYKSDLDKIINQVILYKASRMADMFDNKLAFPYMDLDLYEFLMKLPISFKCRGESVKEIAKGHATAKFLLKYHYKPMLPEVITAKKKQGGFAPMPLFFKDDKQRNRIGDYILSSSIVSDFLKRDKVEAFIRRYDKEVHEDGYWFWYKQNKAIQYFNLLTLAIWWEQVVKGKQVQSLL